MVKNKLGLDELEIAIQLIQIDKPELKKVTYLELKEALETEFNAEIPIEDIYLLYEPTIQQDEEAMQIYYSTMFNVTRDGQYY